MVLSYCLCALHPCPQCVALTDSGVAFGVDSGSVILMVISAMSAFMSVGKVLGEGAGRQPGSRRRRRQGL